MQSENITIQDVRVRPVMVPMKEPHRTASGIYDKRVPGFEIRNRKALLPPLCLCLVLCYE